MKNEFRHSVTAIASMVAVVLVQFFPLTVPQVHAGSGGYYSPIANYKTEKYPYNLVKKAQKKLIKLGYNVGKIDGAWGTRTSDAIKDFQKKEQIEASGELDEATKKALFQVK